MAFMEPFITIKQDWIEIDGPCGRDFVPAELVSGVMVATIRALQQSWKFDELPEPLRDAIWSAVSDFTENSDAYTVEVTQGYGVRLSADGYMDCTAWSVYSTKREALRAARELAAEE